MGHGTKSWIEGLQALDERTKHKVLIAATIVIMIIVIYLWLAYFNNLVAGIGNAGATDTTGNQAVSAAPVAQPAVQNPGFFGSIGNAITSLPASFMGAMHWLGRILDAPRQYIINPPQ
jgi:hypothetical protein